MFLVLASIGALCMGPALALIPGKRRQAIVAIDGFVVVAVGGLVLFDILPHSLADAGWPAWLAAAMGLLAPAALHGPMEDCSGRAAQPLIVAGALAFAVHALFDGVALVNHTGHASLLGWAVVLHRVLEGLAIWWLIRPHQGARITWLFLATIAGATLVGYWGGDRALQHGFAAPLGMLQAAVAGSLLHVLLRHAPPDVAASGNRWHLASGLGGLAAGGILVVMLAEHTHGDARHVHPAPAIGVDNLGHAGHLCMGLLLSYAITALLHALWESRTAAMADGFWSRSPWRQAVSGAWAGLTVAECSCGVVPLYRRLLKRDAGRTRALAFLFAAPLGGGSGLMLSWWMLGARLTFLRAGVTLALAVMAALLARVVSPGLPAAPAETRADAALAAEGTPHHASATPAPHCHTHHRGRIKDALHFTLGEVLDRSSPWALFGLILAQMAAGAHLEAWHGSAAEVVLVALIATPFYLSATAATVVAAALIACDVSTGAVLAFLLLSPAFGLGTITLIRKQYGTKVCAWVTAGVWAAAVAVGLEVSARDPVATPAWIADGAQGILGMAAMVCIGGLFLFSLLRQGVRTFLGQVAVPNTLGTHSHHHDHGEAPAASA